MEISLKVINKVQVKFLQLNCTRVDLFPLENNKSPIKNFFVLIKILVYYIIYNSK